MFGACETCNMFITYRMFANDPLLAIADRDRLKFQQNLREYNNNNKKHGCKYFQILTTKFKIEHTPHKHNINYMK